jgi:hypothetical protein
MLDRVAAVRRVVPDPGINEGPIFRAVDKHGHVAKAPLSDRSVARVVQRAALAAGLGPSRYGGHSLRSGSMTTAAEKGRPLEANLRQTGHKSKRVARGYIQHATVFVNNRQEAGVMGDGPSVLVTLRLSTRDRALLEGLVEHERQELADFGVEVSLSSVMRKLIRAAAKASVDNVAGDVLPRRPVPSAPAPPPSTNAGAFTGSGAGAPAEEDGRARAGVEVQSGQGVVPGSQARRPLLAAR